MKKLILFLALVAIAIACTPSGATAQERTVNVTVPPGNTYHVYTGTTSDVLIPTTTDTIDVIFWFRVDEYVTKVAVKARYDMRVLADTTVALTVAGKEFYDHTTYTDVIASTVSSAVTSNNVIQVVTLDPYTVEAGYVTGRIALGDTTNVQHNHTPFDISYRYYRCRFILQGNDATGTGVKLDELEIKLYTE